MIKGMLREVYFHSGGDPDARVIAHLAALCPACGFEHSFSVDLEGHGLHTNDVWSFNGDYDKPTFNPSMLCEPCTDAGRASPRLPFVLEVWRLGVPRGLHPRRWQTSMFQ